MLALKRFEKAQKKDSRPDIKDVFFSACVFEPVVYLYPYLRGLLSGHSGGVEIALSQRDLTDNSGRVHADQRVNVMVFPLHDVGIGYIQH